MATPEKRRNPRCTGDSDTTSEQRGRQVLPSPEHTGVVVADGAEEAEEVLAGLVAVVAGGTTDQVDEAVERVLDVAAEHVEIGDQRLGVDVVGVRGGGVAGGVEVGTLRALE